MIPFVHVLSLVFQLPHIFPLDAAPNSNGVLQPKFGRIVGGNIIPHHKYPALAIFHIRGWAFCGATILNKYWALTAAHCLQSLPSYNVSLEKPEGVTLAAGIFNKSDLSEERAQVRNVAFMINHELFDMNKVPYNDIGLMRVSEPFLFNKYISPANLADCDFEVLKDGEVTATTVGWGKTNWNFGNDTTDYRTVVPMEVDVPLLTLETCQRLYFNISGNDSDPVGRRHQWWTTDQMVCAGELEGGKDACTGDSGGPLFIKNEQDQTYMQVGIVSFGFKCGLPNAPGVYVRIARYLGWISDHMLHCVRPPTKKPSR